MTPRQQLGAWLVRQGQRLMTEPPTPDVPTQEAEQPQTEPQEEQPQEAEPVASAKGRGLGSWARQELRLDEEKS